MKYRIILCLFLMAVFVILPIGYLMYNNLVPEEDIHICNGDCYIPSDTTFVEAEDTTFSGYDDDLLEIKPRY